MNNTLNRRMFMQQGGVVPSQTMLPPAQTMAPQMMAPPAQTMLPPAQMEAPPAQVMDPQMMAPPPQMMDPSMPPPGATQQVAGELMEQEGAALTDGIMSQVDSAQDYEELMNAIRGNELPIASRRGELAEYVGTPDAEQTPDSVLTLVQPTLSIVDAQGGLDSLMQEQADVVMEDGTGAPTQMAGGLGSMLMAGQPEEPVQMADGGLVRKMANGSTGSAYLDGPVPTFLPAPGPALSGINKKDFMDRYKSFLPTFMEAAGTPDKDLQKTQAYASLAGAGLRLAQGSRQPGATFLGDLAGAFQPVPGELTAIASQGNKEKTAARLQAAALSGQMLLEDQKRLTGISSGKSVQVGGPQVNPATGEMFVITLDPNGKVTKEPVLGDSGAVQIALTPAEEADLEAKSAAAIRGAEAREDAEKELYTSFSNVSEFVGNFEELLVYATKAVNEGKTTGTGIFGKYLPALNEYSSQIRSIRGRLGLGVVGSVTFGALSKGELDLAMSINFNPSLKGDELINDITNRLNAKKKIQQNMQEAYERLRNAPSLEAFRDGEVKTMKQREKVKSSWSEYEEAFRRANPEQWAGKGGTYWRDEISPDTREALLRRLLGDDGFNEFLSNNS